jgi:hypothetical protein
VCPSSRRLTHFVAAALPKVPIRALKLGDRTSLAHNVRGFPSELRLARSTNAAAPPVQFRELVWPGRFPVKKAFFFHFNSAPSSRRLMHLVAAALPKSLPCVLKLGDRTSSTGVTCGSLAGCRRARRFSAATPPVLYGVTRA